YFEELDSYCEDDDITPWLEISSKSPTRVIEEIKANISSDQPSPTPFIGCTIDQIYAFFKAHLRPADDSTTLEHFTTFTFLVVDEECVQSTPWQCILCSDAPDFGEADEEVKLKTLRMPIEQAMGDLCALEQLTMTPSEALDPGGLNVGMMPPPTMVPIGQREPDGQRLYKVATPVEARANKRRGIRMAEEADRTERRE
ncbi:MAG: hypothetical protein Q9164_007351, partial [Protoblastenia rupestris]